jgi:membrane protein YdbS with pleckstrin-like domain
MGNYVRATLAKDEYVLYEAKISLWSQLPLILIGVCLLVSAAPLTTTASVQFVLVMLALGLIPLIVVFLRYKSTELCITNLRIIANFGLFSRHSIEMKLSRVESIQLRQGISGRLFNYGSLVISGAGNPMAPVPDISNPLEFRRVAMEAHEHQSESAQTYSYRSAGGDGGGVRLVGFLSLGIAVVMIAAVLKHVLSAPPKEVASTEIAQTHTGYATSYARSKPSPSTPSSKDAGFKTYTNERYGFRIDYPQSFVAGQAPENGDGIKFESPDGHATLVVSGSNDPGQGLAAYYSDSLQSTKGELGYHTLGKNWFVITSKDGETLNYQKTFVGSASENSFTMSFPVDEKSTYDDVVTHLQESFHHGDLEHAQ